MTKRELSQLYWLKKEIAQDKARLAELEAASSAASVQLTWTPGGGGASDRVGMYAAEIADLRSIIGANIRRCWREMRRLSRYISTVEDSQMRQILTLRYIECLTWNQVADVIGTNENAVKQAHSRFLRKDCHTCHDCM